jgi:hypothetical protein
VIAVDGGSAAAVALSNRKDRVRAEARRLGVPWSEGQLVCWPHERDCFDAADELLAAVRLVGAKSGGAFVRGVWSMHGADNIRIAGDGLSRARLAEWLSARPSQRSFLVEPLLPVCASPNVQLWIDDDGSVQVVAVTGQRLDDRLIHRGNAFPHPSVHSAQLREWSIAMGGWLASAGYRGPLGLDFLETLDPRTGRDAALLVEVNGRINGATYALAVTERLDAQRSQRGLPPVGCWRSATDVPTPARSFAELAERLGDSLLADVGRFAGVVPYNIGLLQHGSVFLLMVAGTPDELEDLERAVLARVRAG